MTVRTALRASLPALAALALATSAVSMVGCAANSDSGATLGANDVRESESVRCAAGSTVEGLDVSYYQGNVDWASVKASGREFAIARISDGGYHDSKFARNWSGMQAAGLIRGAYQYFEPGQDPVAQADMVIAAVGHLGAGDLPVTLDVEATGGQSQATIAERIHTWADRVQAATGKTPMIYTGKYFWQDHVGSNDFGGSALWIAAYGPTCPNIPGPWVNWKFFQYTDSGHVPGISGGVDLNKFNGSLAELEAFAGGDGGTTVGGTTGGGAPGGGTTGSVKCYSHTLSSEVPLNTCVQSRSDGNWYQCSGPNHWVDRWSDPAACVSVHPL